MDLQVVQRFRYQHDFTNVASLDHIIQRTD